MPLSPFSTYTPDYNNRGGVSAMCPLPTAPLGSACYSTGHHSPGARRRHRRGVQGGRGHGSRRKSVAYPPLVCGVAPEAVSGLLEGMEEPQVWAHFVALLRCGIRERLASGEWRSGRASKIAFGVSCPRF